MLGDGLMETRELVGMEETWDREAEAATDDGDEKRAGCSFSSSLSDAYEERRLCMAG